MSAIRGPFQQRQQDQEWFLVNSHLDPELVNLAGSRIDIDGTETVAGNRYEF
jgi:hypothetical protein